VIHCGAKAASRRWPAERFAAVARMLADDGHDVVVTGGWLEADLVRSIARSAGVEGTHQLGLEELCALVASACLVVCGDTGVAHVASNYQTSSVVLFGPVSPVLWGPPRSQRHQVLWHGDGSGDPHGETPDPALLRITVDEVMAAVERVMHPLLAGPRMRSEAVT
jgi:ADP-heptose:LPS heptosyltransferase